MEKQMMTLKGMNWRGKEDNKAFEGAKKEKRKPIRRSNVR
jgi:hypothetical protein